MHFLKMDTASRSIALKGIFLGLMAGIAAPSCAQGRFSDLRFADSSGKRWKLDLAQGKRSAEAGEEGIIFDVETHIILGAAQGRARARRDRIRDRFEKRVVAH